MPRKHLIASQTSKKQQAQAKIWLKLAKEIKAAAKINGPNPSTNSRLKAAIDKALQNNLSKESIEKNIRGSQKDTTNLMSFEYECYGINGLQIIVDVLTDNQSRAFSNLRNYLAKIRAEIAKPNSVKIFFDKLGIIVVYKDNNTVDSILEKLLEYNVSNILDHDDNYEILVDPTDFYNVKEILNNNNIKIFEADIKYYPQSPVEIDDEEYLKKIEQFIDNCDQDDDIQSVVTNLA